MKIHDIHQHMMDPEGLLERTFQFISGCLIVNQSIKQANKQSIKQAVNRSINQPVNQTIYTLIYILDVCICIHIHST
jgi:hypothetical protein